MNETVKFLLNGVRTVPKCANPGTLVVFEQTAYPIVCGGGKEKSSGVLFAAAEYGKGRVFVVTHESYLDKFAQLPDVFEPLWTNVKHWLTREANYTDDRIRNIEEFETVADIPSDVKLVKWVGVHNKTELFISQLLKKYVLYGGSVVCGVCPWGWLNISHGKTLDEMSLNKFLCSVGICFTAELFDFGNSNQINVYAGNEAPLKSSHFGNAINTLAANVNEIKNLEDILIKSIQYLPCNTQASKHLEKLHKILYGHISTKCKPSLRTNITSPIERSLLSVCSKVYQKFSNYGMRAKAANIDEFPGTFPNQINADLKTVILEIRSKYDEFHCTGCYLVPGSAAQLTVIYGNSTGWEVRIGSHTDDLTDMKSYKRWPAVSSSIKLKKTLTLTSAFGGLIYLESPKGNSTLKVKLESVLESPHYDLTKYETVKKWPTSRRSPGLWAEICGKHISFVVPSNKIRDLDNPEEALKIWDGIIAANHDLRGTNVSATWRQRVVVDIQPYSDQIHSGYPVVISYDYAFSGPNGSCFLFNAQEIFNKGWDLIHELGHNMQRPLWTPHGTEEVTVNLFTLHAYEAVFDENAWTNSLFKEKQNKNALVDLAQKNFPFDHWCSQPYVALILYAQLIKAFGWNAFKVTFREYETLNSLDHFKSDTDKWNQWIERFSSVANVDVSPLFLFWGIPFTKNSSTTLTPWLADDQFTRMFPSRVTYVKNNYPTLLIRNTNEIA